MGGGPQPCHLFLLPCHSVAPCRLPVGLEDVSGYPALVAELLRRNWTEGEVKGALANNLLRVLEKVEQVGTPQAKKRSNLQWVGGRKRGALLWKPRAFPPQKGHSLAPSSSDERDVSPKY